MKKVMVEGQKFLSQSKIQEKPEEYIYCGILHSGDYLLQHSSISREKDCIVDKLWFGERKITLSQPENNSKGIIQ